MYNNAQYFRFLPEHSRKLERSTFQYGRKRQPFSVNTVKKSNALGYAHEVQ